MSLLAPSAWIVALDGLVFDTRALRAHALYHAMHQEHVGIARETIDATLPGRTLREAVRILSPTLGETDSDLIVIAAQREISRGMTEQLTLRDGARAWISRCQSRGERVVARADALRRDVDRAVMLAQLDQAFAITLCADDLSVTGGESMLERAYGSLTARLLRSRIGAVSALEVSDAARAVAATFVANARVVDELP